MSLCVRFLTARNVRCTTPLHIIQVIQTRGLRREYVNKETVYNPTHNSFYKHYKHGRSAITAKSLAQILEAQEKKIDPRVSYLVDIGLPPPRVAKRSSAGAEKTKLLLKNRSDPELERQARHKTLEVSLEEARQIWEETLMPQEYCNIAKHFGIFNDLFGDAYFFPRVPLNVMFKQDSGDSIKVLRGNIIKPSQVQNSPAVSFSAEPESLWTLVLTNPDGHLSEENSEYVHWFIGNIPGNDVSKGEVIWDYLQPFPPHGTGYQRLIFVLYKQEEKLDYSALQKKSPCLDLTQRTFNTYDFYRERQDLLTPAGFCFYQSVWDDSVTDFYHFTLEMEEPRYMFNFPKEYHPAQKWFPILQPFDLYLDRYKDPKDINKRYLMKKLAETHPFEKPPPPLKFPLAQPFKGYVPSWLKQQMRRDRMGWGQIRNV